MKRQIFILALFTAALLAGCTAQKDENTAGQNGTLKDRDALQQKDSDILRTMDIEYKDWKYTDTRIQCDVNEDAMDVIPEILWFYPKDAGEGAKCTQWTKTTPEEYAPHPRPKMDCWDPPEHWCQFMFFAAPKYYSCTPDGKLCCNTYDECHPCGWIHVEKSGKDTDPEKCEQIRCNLYAHQWMVCTKWHY